MAKRERVEDLGRVAEKLGKVVENLEDLMHFIKAIRPTPMEGDLERVFDCISLINSVVEDTWEIARHGDDDE
jgi:hypothetical protein